MSWIQEQTNFYSEVLIHETMRHSLEFNLQPVHTCEAHLCETALYYLTIHSFMVPVKRAS